MDKNEFKKYLSDTLACLRKDVELKDFPNDLKEKFSELDNEQKLDLTFMTLMFRKFGNDFFEMDSELFSMFVDTFKMGFKLGLTEGEEIIRQNYNHFEIPDGVLKSVAARKEFLRHMVEGFYTIYRVKPELKQEDMNKIMAEYSKVILEKYF